MRLESIPDVRGLPRTSRRPSADDPVGSNHDTHSACNRAEQTFKLNKEFDRLAHISRISRITVENHDPGCSVGRYIFWLEEVPIERDESALLAPGVSGLIVIGVSRQTTLP